MSAFVTTAIPYVNARPHLGFAYELVLADVLARHHKRRGRDVRFSTGTDENSLKNVAAAARAGEPVAAFVERNAAAFRALGPLLGALPDDFVRTAVDPRHRTAVEWLWRACAGDLYRRAWTGRYCTGCEAFVDVDLCEEHNTAPEPVSEDNWFFRLSRYREPLVDAIESGRLAIVPDGARVETLRFLAGEVRDISVSRDAGRAGGWGIPVPGDPTQVIYVWFDALASYLASLGLGNGDPLLDRYWLAGGERAHVIGKGITRFHAVYWPAFLLAAGLPLPDKILVHGYLTVDGKKIAKTDTPVDVEPIVAAYGADAVRWYFARRCRTRGDADVRLADIAVAHDGDLVGRLGNLVHRATTLLRISGGGVERDDGGELRALAEALPARVDAALAAFVLDDAVGAVIELVDAANRTLDRTAPWQVAKTDRALATRLVYAPLEAARIAAGELAPFVPGVAAAIEQRLGDLSPGWGGLAQGVELAGAPPLQRLNTT